MVCNSIRSTLSNKAVIKSFVTAIFAYRMTLKKSDINEMNNPSHLSSYQTYYIIILLQHSYDLFVSLLEEEVT